MAFFCKPKIVCKPIFIEKGTGHEILPWQKAWMTLEIIIQVTTTLDNKLAIS